MLSALKADCVIFDLDGTLVDTAPDLLDTLNTIFARLGRRPIDLKEIRGIIGHGARAMLRKGGELTGNPFSESEIEMLFQDYIVHYTANIANKSVPYPDAEEVLNALQQADVPMAICTNKLESLSWRLLKRLDWDTRFAAVVGSDTLPVKKPDPRVVKSILSKTGASADKTLFVGDSETDVQAARAAGSPVILVDYGYSAKPVKDLKPDKVISRLAEIL